LTLHESAVANFVGEPLWHRLPKFEDVIQVDICLGDVGEEVDWVVVGILFGRLDGAHASTGLFSLGVLKVGKVHELDFVD